MNFRSGGIGAIAVIFLLFAACHKPEPPLRNYLYIGLESGPRHFDPRLSTDAASSKMSDLLYNGLVKRNDDFTISGDLAQSWENPTPTRYIFHLRDDVLFHDGRKFSSKDIKSAIEFVLDPENKSPYKSSFDVVESVTTPDDRTVIFNLKEPSAPFLGNLTLGITPAGAGNEIAEQPIGTGPFGFVEYKTEERVVLKRHDQYFDGAPRLDGVVFKVVPDETVRTLELEKGSIHIITNPISPDILPRFRENDRLNVVTRLGTNYSYLGFNLEDELAGNHAVRRAIAYAIDRDKIIEHILKGLAKPASGMISESSTFFEKDVVSYEYDPEKAKAVLDGAGFVDPDGDGPKMRFTLHYSTSQNELRKRIAEVFQWQLGKVGVGLDIRSSEWGAFYANIKKGNFQLFSLTWVGIADPDIFYYIFHSGSAPPDGANRGRYRNDEIDRLAEKGRVTFGDERKAIYSKAQKILAGDLPYVSLWHSVNVAVMSKKVRGFELAPDENLKSVRNVYLEQAE